MIDLYSSNEIKNIDEHFSVNYGVPSIVLMENAAINCTSKIIEIANNDGTIHIFCGQGNNGGDGFAIARHLYNLGKNVNVFFCGDTEKLKGDSLTNYNIITQLDIKVIRTPINLDSNFFRNNDIVIDAILGIGFDGELRKDIQNIIQQLNNLNCSKIAIDIPTGLNSDTGISAENTFRADYTLTMYSPKLGMYIGNTYDFCGEIIVCSLGVPAKQNFINTQNYLLEVSDLSRLNSLRNISKSKFENGRLVIIAGSETYLGASALCANAAIKTGVGLVELISIDRHPHLLPEIIFHNLNLNNDSNYWTNLFEKADAILIGPGIGKDVKLLNFMIDIFKKFSNSKKMILDAEAIRLINQPKLKLADIIITPHYGELANLIYKERTEIMLKPKEFACSTAQNHKVNVLLKGKPTFITNSSNTYINSFGNPGMGTAGSGDVLSGIIGALAARGLNTLEAGYLGSLVHTLSSDYYVKNYNESSLTASEIINNIKNVLD